MKRYEVQGDNGLRVGGGGYGEVYVGAGSSSVRSSNGPADHLRPAPTLRDQFAMAALTVAVEAYGRMSSGEADRILGRSGVKQSEEKYRLDRASLIAKLAYEAADAMMKERAK